MFRTKKLNGTPIQTTKLTSKQATLIEVLKVSILNDSRSSRTCSSRAGSAGFFGASSSDRPQQRRSPAFAGENEIR